MYQRMHLVVSLVLSLTECWVLASITMGLPASYAYHTAARSASPPC